jgi:hypothetical protein
MIVHERYDGASWLLALLIGLGAASVWWWRAFGDLRPYLWVQFFPLLAIVTIVIFDKPRHTGEVSTLSFVVGAYLLAKIFETYDRAAYVTAHHVVSGHTLKHVIAAAAALAIALWIARRAAPVTCTQGPQ